MHLHPEITHVAKQTQIKLTRQKKHPKLDTLSLTKLNGSVTKLKTGQQPPYSYKKHD